MTGEKSFQVSWGKHGAAVEEWLARASKTQVVKRLWEKDPTLWKKDAAAHAAIQSRLGWLTVLPATRGLVPGIKAFASQVHAEGFKHIVLLGMGGSSLGPEVFQKLFGNAKNAPELAVLDSTDPAAVLGLEKRVDLEKTLFVVSSKSGGTIELLSFFKYFLEKMKALKGEAADSPATELTGRHFIAITDPGTPLVSLAKLHNFRKVFLAPEDVGGRFSVLTVFGMIPAALIGVDVTAVLDSADRMALEAAKQDPLTENSSAVLGVAMTVLAEEGRDKLTIVTSPSFLSFGDWAEQLVAESTGKEDAGIIPVVGETLASPEAYGDDRFFVAILPRSEDTAAIEKKLAALDNAGHPVVILRPESAADVGGEFFRWEVAVAVACSLLKIDAFDQPDVQAAKDKAKTLLKAVEGGEPLLVRTTEVSLETFWENAEPGNYISILAFLPPSESFYKKLRHLATEARDKTRLAVTVGLGPRYLHSTGQLHKGGPNTGLFILISGNPEQDAAVPGEKYSFGTLELAQAMGDFEALETRGHWLIHLRMETASEAELDLLCEKIQSVLQKMGVVAP